MQSVPLNLGKPYPFEARLVPGEYTVEVREADGRATSTKVIASEQSTTTEPLRLPLPR